MNERLERIEALLLATAERQNEMNASLQHTQAAFAEQQNEMNASLQHTQAAFAEQQNEMNASLQHTQAILDRTAEQQATNTREIDILLGAISTNEVELRAVVQRIDESNQRFDVLRQEAIADRQESNQRSEVMRKESDQRFEAMQENIQRLFLELHGTNRRVDTLEQAS
ncbi:MAG: hypothetical protein AAFV90_07080 [Cyanobacteria bacterium J06634_5]